MESSADLATWDASPLYYSSLDGAPALADGWASVSVAAPPAGRRFYRLRIDLR